MANKLLRGVLKIECAYGLLQPGPVTVIVGSRGRAWRWRYMGLGDECHGLARWGHSR
jgi:hypothetical protein